MEHFAAIDVSLEWSGVCVVDAAGQIVREAKVRSERADLVAVAPSSSWYRRRSRHEPYAPSADAGRVGL
jgi:hypothetical protein